MQFYFRKEAVLFLKPDKELTYELLLQQHRMQFHFWKEAVLFLKPDKDFNYEFLHQKHRTQFYFWKDAVLFLKPAKYFIFISRTFTLRTQNALLFLETACFISETRLGFQL